MPGRPVNAVVVMPAPAIVIIWVVGAELASPGISELGKATQQVLGPSTEVRFSQGEGEEWPRPRASNAAVGMVRLEWDANTAEPAHLWWYLPRFGRWVNRDVVFEASDPERERGRTIGFVLASVLLEQDARQPVSAPPRDTAKAAFATSALHELPVQFALSAAVEGAGPSTGTGFGAYVGVQRALVNRTWWLGGSARVRFGSIAEAQASTLLLSTGPEFTWLPWWPTRSSFIGMRGSIGVSYLSVSHLSDDDIVADEQARWLPGAELALHGGVELARSVAIFSDLGVTVVGGETALEVRHRVAAVWPWASGLLRVGIRSQF